MVILSFILALLALVSSIVSLIVVAKIAFNLSRHVKNLKNAFYSFKESIEKDIGKVGKELKDHSKEQQEWEKAIKKWVQDQFATQHLQNEQAVQKVSDALDSVAKSRETMAASFRDFVALLRAAMRAEKALLEKPADPPGTA